MKLRTELEKRLAEVVPGAVIFASDAERLPNTVFMAVPGLEGQTLIMALDQQDIAVSSGSACGSEHTEPSTVLKAMKIESELALGAIRISLGKDNTERDVEVVTDALASQVKQLKSLAAATAW
jgi:cysteine desulfurase